MKMIGDSPTKEKDTAVSKWIPHDNAVRPLKRSFSLCLFFSQKSYYDNGIRPLKRSCSSCSFFSQMSVSEGRSLSPSTEPQPPFLKTGNLSEKVNQLTKAVERINVKDQILTSSIQTINSEQKKAHQKGTTRQTKKVSVVAPYRGLSNLGATCYLNAALQVLCMTEDFRNTVLQGTLSDKNVGLESALKDLFKELKDNSSAESVSTRKIIKSLGIQNVYEQQDAVEFFLYILENVGQDLSKVFTGTMTNSTRCSENHVLSDDSPFKSLQIPVNSSDGLFRLEDGLKLYFESTQLINDNQMYCDQCCKKCDTELSCNIKEHPTILSLHLKRFAYNVRYGAFEKNDCLVEVPFHLIVQKCDYTLYAVINHMGGFYGGHYNAVIRPFDNDKWYCFNDSHVTETDEDKLKVSRYAYLMLYKKSDETGGPAEAKSSTECGGDTYLTVQKAPSNVQLMENMTKRAEIKAGEPIKLVEASSTQCGGDTHLTVQKGQTPETSSLFVGASPRPPESLQFPSTSSNSPQSPDIDCADVMIPWNKSQEELVQSMEREPQQIVGCEITQKSSDVSEKKATEMVQKMMEKYPKAPKNVKQSTTPKIKKRKYCNDEFDTDETPLEQKAAIQDPYEFINRDSKFPPPEETPKSQQETKEKLKMMSLQSNANPEEVKLLMQSTSNTQQKHVNQGKNPFNELDMADHFKDLIGIRLKETFTQNVDLKGKWLLNYMNTVIVKKNKKFLQAVKKFKVMRQGLSGCSEDVKDMVLLLLAYFDEKEDVMFCYVKDTCLAGEVQMDQVHVTPTIIVCGQSCYSSRRFMLSVDQTIILDNILSFVSAICMMFGSYYCFNIHYPSELASTLEFLQRFFFSINPGKGNKLVKTNTSRVHANPGVLTLIQKVLDHK